MCDIKLSEKWDAQNQDFGVKSHNNRLRSLEYMTEKMILGWKP